MGLVLGAQAQDVALSIASLSQAPGEGHGAEQGHQKYFQNFLSHTLPERSCNGGGAALKEHRAALARRTGKQEGGALRDGVAGCREPQSAARTWGSAPAIGQAPSQPPRSWGATPWPAPPPAVHATSTPRPRHFPRPFPAERGRPWFRDTECPQCQRPGKEWAPQAAPDPSISCADMGHGPEGNTEAPCPAG